MCGGDYSWTRRVMTVCGVSCFAGGFYGLFSHFNKDKEVNEFTNKPLAF